MRFPPVVVTLSLVALLPWSPVVLAQDAPARQYSIKEDSPRLGTRVPEDQVTGGRIALNLPYAQLQAADKQALHSWWENIRPGDEPPFPEGGLRAVYEPLRQAYDALPDPGELYAIAAVGPDGKVAEAKVLAAPSEKMAKFAAQLLMLTPFKPAVCSGQPCRMDFPLRMKPCASAGDQQLCECIPKWMSVMNELGFPRAAVRAGFNSGEVVAEFSVTPNGTVENIQVLNTTHPAFSESVARVLGKAKLCPTGKTEPVRLKVPFTFRLK